MITREKFERFVEVQAEGLYNMVTSEAREAARLTKEEHIEILSHYEVYEDMYDIHVEDYE